MKPQATVDGAARELRIDTALHDFGDVVEAEADVFAQFADQRFLGGRGALSEVMPGVRAVGHAIATFPAAYGGLADAELGGNLGHGGLALLNVGPRLRRCRGVGVQADLHGILARQDRPIRPQSRAILHNRAG